MAGSVRAWYMPITWPVGHVLTAIKVRQVSCESSDVNFSPCLVKAGETDRPAAVSAPACLDLPGHLVGLLSSARSWLLAYLCVFYLPGQHHCAQHINL